MKTIQLPRIKRIQASRGPAWQATATVGAKRRKVQRYEDPADPSGAEREVRQIALQWAADQQGATCTHTASTALTNEQLRFAEKLFGCLSKAVDLDLVEELFSRLQQQPSTDLVGLKLTDEQARIALQLFASLPADGKLEQVLEIGRLRFGLSDQQLQVAPVLLGLLPPSATVKQVQRFAPFWFRDLSRPEITLQQAVDQFLDSRTVQAGQMRTYRSILRSLTVAIGAERPIVSINTEELRAFLDRFTNPTTWNKRRADIATLFNWAIIQELLETSPIRKISKRAEEARDETPATVPIATAAALMKAVEEEVPGLVPHFALCLFAGCRPTWREGEAYELIHRFPERRAGYFRATGIHMPAVVSKIGVPRVIPYDEALPLPSWIRAYPPGLLPIPTDPERRITELRKRFGVPHDGLRHTAISAALAGGMPLTRATLIFGVDESTMITHYASLLSAEAAQAFRGILPIRSAEKIVSAE